MNPQSIIPTIKTSFEKTHPSQSLHTGPYTHHLLFDFSLVINENPGSFPNRKPLGRAETGAECHDFVHLSPIRILVPFYGWPQRVIEESLTEPLLCINNKQDLGNRMVNWSDMVPATGTLMESLQGKQAMKLPTHL